MSNELRNYIQKVCELGLSDKAIVSKLVESGWKEENILSILQSKTSTPKHTSKGKSTYIFAATALILLVILVFFAIRSNQLLKIASLNNDIASSEDIIIDSNIGKIAQNTYTHPSGKYSFNYPAGTKIDDVLNQDTLAEQREESYYEINYEKIWQDYGYTTTINDSIHLYIFGDDEVVNNYFEKTARGCSKDSLVKCIVKNAQANLAQSSKTTSDSIEHIKIGKRDVLKLFYTIEGRPATYERGIYLSVSDSLNAYIFVEVKYDSEPKIPEETVALAEMIIETLHIEEE